MSEKRRGLGKGLGALIPTAPTTGRPVDVFFPEQPPAERAARGEYIAQPDENLQSLAAATTAAPAGSKTRSASSGTATKARSTGTTARRGTSKRAKIPADTLTPRSRTTSAATAVTGTSPDPAPTPASADEARSAPTRKPSTRKPAVASTTTKATPARASKAASAKTSAKSPATKPAEPPVEALDGAAADEPQLVAVPGATFAEIAVNDVVANRRQPRQVFDEDELDELAASIREVGVLQPIVVRPIADDGDVSYELIMGERRWRASQLAGNTTVPAIIRQVEDNDLLRDALLENLHRAQLNPLEEAAAYQQLLEDFDCTHEELAARIVRSRPQISNTLRLLKLPPLVQRRLAAGVLSAGHARALLGLADAGAMERLAQRIVAEGLSVRSTEEIVALGEEPMEPELRRRPRTNAYTAELNEIATKLADRFDTRVKIGMGQRKGRINIEFASVEDLNRILDVLAPEAGRIVSENDAD